MFWKLDLFLSSSERREAPTLLSPLERANVNHWITEDGHRSSFKMLCFLVFRFPKEGQSPETQ
jgi:hypothetical protein